MLHERPDAVAGLRRCSTARRRADSACEDERGENDNAEGGLAARIGGLYDAVSAGGKDDAGALVASGSPQEIRQNARVIEAYVGQDKAAAS